MAVAWPEPATTVAWPEPTRFRLDDIKKLDDTHGHAAGPWPGTSSVLLWSG